MARIPLNKAQLHQEARRLEMYRRFLPSLDLKRRHLTGALARERAALAATEAEIAEAAHQAGELMPMLGFTGIDLQGLVRVTEVGLGEENVLGTRLPVLGEMRFQRLPYSLLVRPHWVDVLVDCLEAMLQLRVRVQVEAERAARLERAVQKVTQRVNLFDKVLIPRARGNIRRISLYLADAERAGVVRAKLAKGRRAVESVP